MVLRGYANPLSVYSSYMYWMKIMSNNSMWSHVWIMFPMVGIYISCWKHQVGVESWGEKLVFSWEPTASHSSCVTIPVVTFLMIGTWSSLRVGMTVLLVSWELTASQSICVMLLSIEVLVITHEKARIKSDGRLLRHEVRAATSHDGHGGEATRQSPSANRELRYTMLGRTTCLKHVSFSFL